MSIFQTETTQEEEFRQFMKDFVQSNAFLYDMINTGHQDIFNKFWNSQYDPQLIADTLGFEKCMLLFQMSNSIQGILKQDKDYMELIAPKNVDFSTGKVIISDK